MEPVDPPEADGLKMRIDLERDKFPQIVEIADRIRPYLAKIFEDSKDEHGRLVRPSKVRGIALRVAREICEEHWAMETAKLAAESNPTDTIESHPAGEDAGEKPT
jgi:hypothetical protein